MSSLSSFVAPKSWATAAAISFTALVYKLVIEEDFKGAVSWLSNAYFKILNPTSKNE